MHATSELSKLQELREQAQLIIPIRHDPWKRAFDLFFSLFFLILFSPLFLILIGLIWVGSPGPIFYKSLRLGRGGKIIGCWKFRTMYCDAKERLQELLRSDLSFKKEWEVYQKLKKDPRITPIGRFLRRNSLDELPQFWNVLKGDLSVVGPRPPALQGPPDQFLEEIRQLYGESTASILSVRPGVTGMWQISGRSEISFEEKKKIEANYVENRTLWRDLVVLLKTVPAVLFSKGAF